MLNINIYVHSARYHQGLFMKHRHLDHEELAVAAIDDIIERGGNQAWAELCDAVLTDADIRERTHRIATIRTERDPRAQRFSFWKYYVEDVEQRTH